AEMRRELEEERAALVTERRRERDEALRDLAGVAEAQLMRDPLRGLQREAERRRRLAPPRRQQGRRRQAIEGVVDLDGLEDAGVVLEHPARRRLGGIERTLPRWIAESRRADEDARQLPGGHGQRRFAVSFR